MQYTGDHNYWCFSLCHVADKLRAKLLHIKTPKSEKVHSFFTETEAVMGFVLALLMGQALAEPRTHFVPGEGCGVSKSINPTFELVHELCNMTKYECAYLAVHGKHRSVQMK